ncbi:MOSC domain-containing protein [Nocardioides carbamazepini]|uniref:MOSC domain-containing protein n=1 Tax=Nocardioides carbamazepini TaxID=2854259 RepID=UPI00214A4E2D|nr:MOSC domain-containing protein [Nocardioides carbamazepini]MCR1786095.1 MOSC domain-containing protein [Nocardioides carbamazepini]
MSETTGHLLALNIGAVGEIRQGPRRIVTAYHKSPVEGPLELGSLGFPGDEHVYEHHGGPDKAVCVYPYEHYAYWEERLGIQLPASAAFGENFTLVGLTERQVCLGDVFAIGEAVVQVTQPRAPCYKIAARYGVPKMAVYVQQESFTGYLLRVVETGAVEAGQTMRLLRRPEPDHRVTVAEANTILNVAKKDVEGARRLLAVPDLPGGLRPDLERRVREHGAEDDVDRLFGDDVASDSPDPTEGGTR